jgi:hypothetical protein
MSSITGSGTEANILFFCNINVESRITESVVIMGRSYQSKDHLE